MEKFNSKNSNSVSPMRRKIISGSDKKTIHYLKQGIWLYFFLLLFEGALRKWFLPSLSTPLLIVRDPLAVWLIFKSLQKGLLPLNGYIISITLVSIASFLATMIVGHQNLYVAIFGLRIYLLHFPLMFIIGRVFTANDVLKMGKVLLYISIPMIVLLGLQFYSPQSAWVNRGVGGDMAGAGFGNIMGYFRPPGTFSFTLGNTQFWSLATVFVFYFWLYPKLIKKQVLIAATVALIVSIPLSISRGLLFQVALTLVFSLFILIRKPAKLKGILMASVVVLFLVLVLSQTSFFKTGAMVFTERFTTANESEGGLVEGVFIDRFLGGMVGAITQDYDFPFFGHGLGMGTNVGAMLMSGERTFLISEGEWGRLIGEMGILLGLLVILIRTAFVADISIKAYKRVERNNILPWLLLSFGLITLLQGQWAQPTSLGFSTLIGGLILASLKGVKKQPIKIKKIINQ